ncbi:MAG TPA: nucleoid-associated protein [Thermoanaerobaculia bacterium]|nr:nucleoid-associated protein [Thermoanaerobaculia bacterium]
MSALLQRDLPEDEVRSSVHVERAIVHIVDHRNRQKPVLSVAEISLGSDPRLQKYFDDQVRNALRDPATAKARFASAKAAVAGTCYEVLDKPEAFIPNSGHLAEALWKATGSDQRISPGSLVVGLCRADDYPAPLLALLKIDPADVLLQKVTKAPGGERVVEVTVAENGLPTANERLQKAAVVLPRGARPDHDLLLLDRLGKAAADFFARGFLGAEPILTARERTERFYFGARNALNRLVQPKAPEEPRLLPEQAERLRGAIETAVAGASLDVDDWVRSLDLSAPAKEVIVAELDRQLDSRELELDPRHARTLFRKKKLRGDYGVAIEYDATFEEQVFRMGDTYEKDGVRYTRVTVDVPNLQWVKI